MSSIEVWRDEDQPGAGAGVACVACGDGSSSCRAGSLRLGLGEGADPRLALHLLPSTGPVFTTSTGVTQLPEAAATKATVCWPGLG